MHGIKIVVNLGVTYRRARSLSARRLKPRASGLRSRLTLAHEATPMTCGGVAGGFSPTGRGALHDGT
ncbi:MAG: hypothetical protein ACUVS4_13690, partial [Chloroflexaceae bacterium]